MAEIDLRQLTTMIAIAEEGTFSRAANRLGYTQSSVSQHIAALEKALGGAVFDRPGGPRPVRITPLGVVVLEQGRELLAKAAALGHAVDRFKAGDGRIDVGTLQSVSNVILPTMLRRLRDEHPQCEIRLSEAEPDDAQIGDLDLLFYDGLISDETESILLMADPYLVVALPEDLPAGPVPARLLDGKAMVAWPATCDQPRLEQSLAEAGAKPHIVFRSTGNETMLSMVRAGMGLAVLPWLGSTTSCAAPAVRFMDQKVGQTCRFTHSPPRSRARSTCTGRLAAAVSRRWWTAPSRSPSKSRASWLSWRHRRGLDQGSGGWGDRANIYTVTGVPRQGDWCAYQKQCGCIGIGCRFCPDGAGGRPDRERGPRASPELGQCEPAVPHPSSHPWRSAGDLLALCDGFDL